MNANSHAPKRAFPKKFYDKGYRTAFVDAHIGNTIAMQIYALRKHRNWSQSELARESGMQQARISVLEDPDYQAVTVTTLKRLAAAFDVALVVKFVPYGEVLTAIHDLPNENLQIPSFDEESTAPAAPAERPLTREIEFGGDSSGAPEWVGLPSQIAVSAPVQPVH